MSTATAAVIVWLIAFWLIVAWAVAVRLGPALHRRVQPAPGVVYATFTELPPGTRYLVCDTTTCGRLSIAHTPQPNGTWKCASCGNTKGDQ